MPRLRRSDTSGPGIHRLKSGRFRADDGVTISADDRARIKALVIPPAWTDVWISPHANGHIQATGVDDAGRTQYLYHEAWHRKKARLKFDRALDLADALPAARARVTRHLREPEPTRERALAAAFRMLDTGALRVGSERYAEEHGSHGLSTLLCSHASVSGDEVKLDFPGKSGQEWDSVIRDAELADVIRGLKRRGGSARLLAWRDERGWHPVSAEEINDYVREQTGGDFTAKDFRTLHGTATAALQLAKAGPQGSPSARKKVVARVMRDVGAALGNTPAVAKSSYVDPRLVDHYDRGHTVDPTSSGAVETRLRSLLGD